MEELQQIYFSSVWELKKDKEVREKDKEVKQLKERVIDLESQQGQ